MKTLLLANIYKLSKSKSVIGSLICLNLYIIAVYTANINWVRTNNADMQVVLHETSSLTLMVHYLVFCIIIGIHIAGEFRNGLIRNAISIGKSRFDVFLSLYFSASLITVTFFFMSSVTLLIVIITMENFKSINWINVAWFGLVYFSNYLALTATFAFISFISKNFAVAITFCFIYTLIPFLLYGLTSELFFVNIFPHFHIYAYITPRHTIMSSSFLLEGVIKSIVYFLALAFIGNLIFKRSEIK